MKRLSVISILFFSWFSILGFHAPAQEKTLDLTTVLKAEVNWRLEHNQLFTLTRGKPNARLVQQHLQQRIAWEGTLKGKSIEGEVEMVGVEKGKGPASIKVRLFTEEGQAAVYKDVMAICSGKVADDPVVAALKSGDKVTVKGMVGSFKSGSQLRLIECEFKAGK